MTRTRAAALLAILALAPVVSACGSSSKGSSATSQSSTKTAAVNPNAKETPPPGDIPDSTQFVRFSPPGAGYSLVIPEGWARTGSGSKYTFTSNLNSVTVESRPLRGALSASGVKTAEAAALSKENKGAQVQSVTAVHRGGQTAYRVRYLAQSKPNAVTGKSIAEEGERYIYAHGGREAVVTLAGPKGADNVDAWKQMSDSLRWSR